MQNILLLALLAMLNANGTIRGLVANSDQDWAASPSMPVPYAQIQLIDSATLKMEQQISTDRDGIIFNDAIKPGNYFLRIYAPGFKEHVVAVSVKSGKEVDIGKQMIKLGQITEELHTVPKDGSDPWAGWKKEFSKFNHIRHMNGTLVMTVCELMKEKQALSASMYSYSMVIIGTLVQTQQGSWLQQSCSEPLKSGNFIWPAAVALDGKRASDNLNTAEVSLASRPHNEEIDPKDQGRTWAAAYGRLDDREDLVAAPCGDDGKLCGYGFGPISAPAQLMRIGSIRILDENSR